VILGLAARSWHQTSRGPGETIVEVAVGREGVVAVVMGETNDWRILFNNTYTLGGSRAAANQERQALLPILIHGRARSVGVLGVATGSTLAGATLDPALDRIDAFELSPLAARLAQRHFQPFNRGAFRDPRVHLHVDDARWGVSRRTGAFDVVIGDLFLPWRTGEGRLFSVDHFEAVHRSLRPDGLFCQWLPLFQLTRPQYDLIARSFFTVFTNAFLIRGDFYTELPIVGLCAFADGRSFRQIDWTAIASGCKRLHDSNAGSRDPLVRHPEGIALCLLGPLPDPGPGPVNTLANAHLEWDAGRNIVGLQRPWFVGVPAAEYFKEVHRVGARQIPTALQAAHDSGQFFLTLEIAAKVQAPVLENLRAQVPDRLPRALREDTQVDWSLWPMRIKPSWN
jgi:spermidine synthase